MPYSTANSWPLATNKSGKKFSLSWPNNDFSPQRVTAIFMICHFLIFPICESEKEKSGNLYPTKGSKEFKWRTHISKPPNWHWRAHRSSELSQIKKSYQTKSWYFWVTCKFCFIQDPQIPNFYFVNLKTDLFFRLFWACWAFSLPQIKKLHETIVNVFRST